MRDRHTCVHEHFGTINNYTMRAEMYWYKNYRMYVVYNNTNQVVIITSDFKQVKQLLGFLDTSKIPETVYI